MASLASRGFALRPLRSMIATQPIKTSNAAIVLSEQYPFFTSDRWESICRRAVEIARIERSPLSAFGDQRGKVVDFGDAVSRSMIEHGFLNTDDPDFIHINGVPHVMGGTVNEVTACILDAQTPDEGVCYCVRFRRMTGLSMAEIGLCPICEGYDPLERSWVDDAAVGRLDRT